MQREYLKAKRADVYIGNLRFDGIRIISTGEYRLTSPQILEAIGVAKNWFSTLGKRNGISLKALQKEGLSTLGKSGIWVEFETKQGITRAESRSTEEADECWEYFRDKGNQKAKAIQKALRLDSLTDRFDQAYGKDRASVDERREADNRVMDKPRVFHPLFGDENCNKIANFLKTSRGSVKMAVWWNNYVYFTLNSDEWAKLNRENPIVNGRRKQCIHQWLEQNASDRHRKIFDSLLLIVELAANEVEFSEMFSRKFYNVFQSNLF